MFTHELFYALHARGLLPGVAAVEVQLKQGAIMSEFTRYRYNVLLHMGVEGAPPPAPLAASRAFGGICANTRFPPSTRARAAGMVRPSAARGGTRGAGRRRWRRPCARAHHAAHANLLDKRCVDDRCRRRQERNQGKPRREFVAATIGLLHGGLCDLERRDQHRKAQRLRKDRHLYDPISQRFAKAFTQVIETERTALFGG